VRRAAFEAAANAQSMPAESRPRFTGTSEIQEIRIFGDWAYMWARLKVVMTPAGGGTSVSRAGHTLSILHKQTAQWLLARGANMLVPVYNEGK
jgi:ketosteroid isomerase-like protein